MLIGKEEVLNNLYEELANLQTAIREKNDGNKYGDTKQADIYIKYTASIRNLETELAIADLVESGIRFMKYIQQVGTMDQVMETADLWNSFLQQSLKR